jgi:hypothetical protein
MVLPRGGREGTGHPINPAGDDEAASGYHTRPKRRTIRGASYPAVPSIGVFVLESPGGVILPVKPSHRCAGENHQP